jgi:hypothetical protein
VFGCGRVSVGVVVLVVRVGVCLCCGWGCESGVSVGGGCLSGGLSVGVWLGGGVGVPACLSVRCQGLSNERLCARTVLCV